MIWLIVVMASILFRCRRCCSRNSGGAGFGLVWISAFVYASLVAMDFPLPTIMEFILPIKDGTAFANLIF